MEKLKSIRLGKNFTLDEFVVTSTGIDNVPGEREIDNLRRLVTRGLQPLRDSIGVPIRITSGYRSYLVNAAIGGADTSQHLKGEAVDFVVDGLTNQQVIDRIRALRLPYDQLIDEESKGKKWIHWSISSTTLDRFEWLTFRDGVYKVVRRG